MNMEAYNLDFLRKLVWSLQDENKRLKQHLDKANIPYEKENVFVEKIENTQGYDPEQGIGHYVHSRYTRVVDTRKNKKNINEADALNGNSVVRNDMILDDTRACVKAGRTPVILTRYKEQAKYLYENLQKDADHVFLFYGDNSDKENLTIK